MPSAKVALVIGAGDATGGAVARRFAREGYVHLRHPPTRRQAGPPGPADRTRRRQRPTHSAATPAARKTSPRCSKPSNATSARSKLCPSTLAAMSASRSVKLPPASIPRSGKCAPWPASSQEGRPPASWSPASAAPSCSPAPPPVSEAAPVTPPSPAASMLCAPSPKAWQENSVQRASTSPTSSSMAPSTPISPASEPPTPTKPERPLTASSTRIRSLENYWMLHNQPRDAWTHELDLRPWTETW